MRGLLGQRRTSDTWAEIAFLTAIVPALIPAAASAAGTNCQARPEPRGSTSTARSCPGPAAAARAGTTRRRRPRPCLRDHPDAAAPRHGRRGHPRPHAVGRRSGGGSDFAAGVEGQDAQRHKAAAVTQSGSQTPPSAPKPSVAGPKGPAPGNDLFWPSATPSRWAPTIAPGSSGCSWDALILGATTRLSTALAGTRPADAVRRPFPEPGPGDSPPRSSGRPVAAVSRARRCGLRVLRLLAARPGGRGPDLGDLRARAALVGRLRRPQGERAGLDPGDRPQPARGPLPAPEPPRRSLDGRASRPARGADAPARSRSSALSTRTSCAAGRACWASVSGRSWPCATPPICRRPR